MNIYPNTKICSKCKESKSLDNFSVRQANKTDGRQPVCKECNKIRNNEYNRLIAIEYSKNPEVILKRKQRQEYYHLRSKTRRHRKTIKKYGLTPEEYTKMLENQNECCAACHRHYTQFKRRLNVDHCHVTGKVRGLLCDDCNLGLGRLKDSKEILQRLIDYLDVYSN